MSFGCKDNVVESHILSIAGSFASGLYAEGSHKPRSDGVTSS